MLNPTLLSIGLGLLLAAFALILLRLNERRVQGARLIDEKQRALSLPQGKLVYEDADGQGEALSSRDYPLGGKPDYVGQLPDGLPLPIELKLNVYEASAPFNNHIMKLEAYCLFL